MPGTSTAPESSTRSAPALGLERRHAPEGLGAQQRRVAVEHQHVAVEAVEGGLGLQHRVAGAPLLGLERRIARAPRRPRAPPRPRGRPTTTTRRARAPPRPRAGSASMGRPAQRVEHLRPEARTSCACPCRRPGSGRRSRGTIFDHSSVDRVSSSALCLRKYDPGLESRGSRKRDAGPMSSPSGDAAWTPKAGCLQPGGDPAAL